MTPIDRSTRNARTEDPFPKQHYLSRHGGSWLFGYFPWNGKVIVVGFDGSRPDSLQRISENSVCDLLTVEEARRHWKERLDWDYTAVDPKNWISLTYRITVHGIAFRFAVKHETQETNTETFTTVLDRIVKQMKAENKISPVIAEYTNYNYAMEA
jgi:hypothetical protein